MLRAIADRRSIRRFLDRPVSQADIEAVLLAGSLAPSAKNRQPWRFVVARGAGKASLVRALEAGLAREADEPLLPGSRQHRAGAASSFAILAQAPVAVVVVNPLGCELRRPLGPEERVAELCNAQSVGAALENMSLAAADLGLGSLWICDTYFAHDALRQWLDEPGEPMAAFALGYPAESPAPRPRKPLDQLVCWRDS